MSLLEVLGNIGFDWQVALANLVNFLIIFWLLKRFAFKPIARILKDRQAKIDEGLDQAQAAETELMQARSEREGIVNEAKHEANGIVADANERGKALISEATTKAQADAARIIENAEADAQKNRDMIMSNVKKEAAELVVMGVEQVIRDEMSEEVNAKYVERALSKISS